MEIAGKKRINGGWMAFILSFAAAALALLPTVIAGGGVLMLNEDFNWQQQIFNIYIGEVYKSGNIFGWSYLSDLGTGVLSGYSFYNLFSPFTVLFAFLPSKIIPYMTAPLLALKYAVAGVTAYAYLKRFVKNNETAVFGSVLYAFCGLQTVNLLFPFHDATALFPLLLIGAELAAEKKQCEVLALSAALCAITNYYLFVGEIIFLIIYFVFRFMWGKKPKEFLPKLGRCLWGGITGTLIAGFVLLPSFLAVLGNPRTSGSGISLVFGWQEYITILESWFMPADVMSGQSFLFQKGCNSCALCLPFVAMALAFSYCLSNKKSGLTWLLAVLAVVSLFPVFNGIFSLYTITKYYRWYYMFAMVLALASCLAVENAGEIDLKCGGWLNALGVCVTAMLEFAGIIWFRVRKYNDYGMGVRTYLVGLYVLGGLLCAGGLIAIIYYIKDKKVFLRCLLCGTLVAAIVTTGAGAWRYAHGTWRDDDCEGLNGEFGSLKSYALMTDITREDLGLPDDTNYRVRTAFYGSADYYNNSYDNISLTLGVPSVSSFLSTVDSGIFKFYSLLGEDRLVTSPYIEDEAFAALLSCRYYFTDDGSAENIVGSYEYGDGTTVYACEFENFLPMGFVYTDYITEEELETVPKEYRSYVMLNAAVISGGKTAFAEGIGLTHNTEILQNYSENTENNVKTAVDEKLSLAGSEFEYNDNGFTSEITSKTDGLAFFSVPENEGWTATVNGEEAEIISVAGLCGVKVSEGENNIVFTYETPGLDSGLALSVAGCSLLLLTFVFDRKKSVLIKRTYKNDRQKI